MQPPPGTSCANHLDTPASATCGKCARPVCNSCVVFDTAGAATCTTCAAVASAGGGGSGMPWERRVELGFGKAFVETVKLALLRPADGLATPPGGAPIGAPFGFAVLCHSLGMIFATLWQVAWMIVTMRGFGGGVGVSELAVIGGMGIFAGPFAALYWVFLWGGIVHVSLLLLGAGRGGFGATARVQSYASASALLQIIPLVGGMVAVVWSLVIQIVGLASAHGTSGGRTAAAVLLPLLLCCLASAALLGLLAAGFSAWLPNQ